MIYLEQFSFLQQISFADFFHNALFPLGRLLCTMFIAIFIANLLEASKWTKFMAKLADPLIRMGHLDARAGAAFTLAFIAPSAATALLAEAYEKKEIKKNELFFATLFNSTPTFLVHLPSLFALVYSFLGTGAIIYVLLTLSAAVLRTSVTLVFSRMFLPYPDDLCVHCHLEEEEDFSWKRACKKAWKRLRRRFYNMARFTIPCFLLIYLAQKGGLFGTIESYLQGQSQLWSFLRPESISIIVFYIAAESGAALSAAASLLQSSTLSMNQIILALLIGNILSSPMRAFRHQFPSYAGFYTPKLALALIVVSQSIRSLSLLIVTIAYYFWAF